MGGEFKKKGVNVLLGPVVGPAGRVVLSGRNWEGNATPCFLFTFLLISQFCMERGRHGLTYPLGFSIDPYLAGALVNQTVYAIQGAGVMTSTKHFIGNEQETNRNPEGNVSSVSANIDDRTLHELYLWYDAMVAFVFGQRNANLRVPGPSRTRFTPAAPTSCAPTTVSITRMDAATARP